MTNAYRLRRCSTSRLSNIVVLSLFFSCSISATAHGAGFQIPNQSLRAVGIAGATIAYTPGPDSAYYNPANMSFLEDSWAVEASLTTLWLPEIEYEDNRSPLLDGTSDSEIFFLPQVHLTSKDYNDFRFGFALTYPYGLAKSWDQPYPAATANTFSLLVVEANPSLSYAVADTFSIAGGIRGIYSDGEVNSGAGNPPFTDLAPLTALTRDLDADDLQFGYNLAATYRPVPQWRIAATYRSEVDLELEGDATLLALIGQFPVAGYNGSADLSLTLPAVFSLATAYTVKDLTFEITWNRTFWSAIEDLDFNYSQSLLGTVFDGFDRPLPKDWDDSDALRFGITYEVTDSLSTTMGFAIDDTPVPEENLGFELPDSDAYMYSLGLQYRTSKNTQLGISYMYHHTTSRSVSSRPVAGLPGIDGEFTEGGAHAVTIGIITAL